MGRELETSRAVGWTFCLSGNNFLLKCNHLLCSTPPLKDNGQFSVNLGCRFCLKSEWAGNLLTWLRLPVKTGYLTGFKYCPLKLNSSEEAAGELEPCLSLPVLNDWRWENWEWQIRDMQKETRQNQGQRDGWGDPNQERVPALFKVILEQVCVHSIAYPPVHSTSDFVKGSAELKALPLVLNQSRCQSLWASWKRHLEAILNLICNTSADCSLASSCPLPLNLWLVKWRHE